MAGSMNEIARKCFTKANRVTDRFHVQKLTYDAVQEIRIKHRWEALDLENEGYRIAKLNNDRYKVEEFEEVYALCTSIGSLQHSRNHARLPC